MIQDEESGIKISQADLDLEGAAPSVNETLVLPDDDKGVKTIEIASSHLSSLAEENIGGDENENLKKAVDTLDLFRRDWQQEVPLNDKERSDMDKGSFNANKELVDAAIGQYTLKNFKTGDQLGSVAGAVGKRVGGLNKLRVGRSMRGLRGARERALSSG